MSSKSRTWLLLGGFALMVAVLWLPSSATDPGDRPTQERAERPVAESAEVEPTDASVVWERRRASSGEEPRPDSAYESEQAAVGGGAPTAAETSVAPDSEADGSDRGRPPIFANGRALIFGSMGLPHAEGPYTGPPVPDARDFDDLDKSHINGTWYEYSDEGVLLVVTDYRRGVANGYGEAYYEDGTRRGQGWQVGGSFHGHCTFWHEDSTVDVVRTGLYEYGEKLSD